jgi:hypothetical protein
MSASRAAAAGFNQDRGFSFFRAKERESPQKRERKPRASDTAKEENAVRVCDAEKRRFTSPNPTAP